ncbi:MAG: glutaredoxin 3 [Thiobacillus sp.]|nr:glutaredoxin 3 [Thiobacillus sp.]
MLKNRGVTEIDKIRVDLDPVRHEEMMARSGGRRTVPQIFIGGTHVGGFDDMSALDAAGELVPLLNRT